MEGDRPNQEATYRAIGRFMFEFSQLEYALRYYTGAVAGLKEDDFTAVMSHDVAHLCTVATQVLGQRCDEKQRQELSTIIKEVRRLNDIRVRVAHGLWVPFQDGGTVHQVSRHTLKTQMRVDQANELDREASSTNDARAALEQFVWEEVWELRDELAIRKKAD
jgi:hypothetical protein